MITQWQVISTLTFTNYWSTSNIPRSPSSLQQSEEPQQHPEESQQHHKEPQQPPKEVWVRVGSWFYLKKRSNE